MSRISLAQLAGSVRKLNLNRPFVCPILIEIGIPATTRMACAEPLMEEEQAFLAALQSAVTWSLDGNILDMHRADGERAIMAIIKR